MASELEEPSYSTPPKRLKLDNSNNAYSRSSEIDNVSFGSSFKTPDSNQNRKYYEYLAF